MRFYVSAFFVITLSILVWLTLKNEQTSVGECTQANDTISKSHEEYLLQYGWHIKSKCNTSTEIVNYYPEQIETLQTGGFNLESYNNKGIEATITSYRLIEKQQNGDTLSATIYEIDGNLVGGYGRLENWTPGIFSLDDKERLIDEGIIKK